MYTHETTKVDWSLLTRRELQVCYWIARGYRNSAISEKLFLELNSAERHINAIYNKTRLAPDKESDHNPRAALVWLLMRDGIVDRLQEDGTLDTSIKNSFHLTKKERLMADLFALGHSHQRVAGILGMSTTTVWWNYQIILLKCGINGQFGRDWRSKREALVTVLNSE